MHPRAQQLIDTLALTPHPEGGWYRQIFKSEEKVTRHSDGAGRSALSTIYFLLVEGEYSAWHRVQSDEAWHFYEGDPLELLTMECGDRSRRFDPAAAAAALRTQLDPNHRIHVVPAGHWQAARPLGAYTLVGCTVGPGFEFTDFEMIPGPI